MPPTNPASDADDLVSSSSDDPVEEGALSDSKTLRKMLPRPPTVVMVKEALKELDSRKGVTTVAIYNFIKLKYPSVDMGRSKSLIRKSLTKGLESGAFVRPVDASQSAGSAKRRYRLAPIKTSKPKSENVDPNVREAPAKVQPKKVQKAGAAKKDSTREPTQTQEDLKPLKKLKKAEGSATTKTAPAKKPKAKMAAATKAGEEKPGSVKPKGGGKAASASKTKTAAAKTGKASKSKSDAPGKPRKKAGE